MLNPYFINQLSAVELPGIVAHKEMSFTNRNFDKPRDAIPSAVAIVLLEHQNHICFPLIKRHMNLKHHKGQIALPGGRLNENENIFECAIRETEEEIGLSLHQIQVIRPLTNLYIPVSNHIVFPVLCYSSEKVIPVYQSEEVEKTILCSIDELLRFEKQIKKVKITESLWIDAPAFVYKDEIIWGATALILNEFRHLLLKIFNY
ncbi:MAG: CoA pyrophosphatase [Bacteroidia bacterium]|nr:CoA pyrophosphatase [Bacteroidia bacterium]